MAKKILIKSHKRKGLTTKSKVKSHYRKVVTKKLPRKTTTSSIMFLFEHNNSPITASDISNYWGISLLTTKKYLDLLERKGKLKKVMINGKVYWERK